jgi:response regulator RpfG family c-di-GMP phosphodiesterase
MFMVMTRDRVPNIILLQDFEDANTVIAGVLSLKACQVHKTTNLESCLSILGELEEKADVVLIQKQIVLSRDSVLKSIKKNNPAIIVIVLADSGKDEDEDKLQEQQVDEFVQTPISAENLADKILMLIAKKELKRIRETQLKNDPIER